MFNCEADDNGWVVCTFSWTLIKWDGSKSWGAVGDTFLVASTYVGGVNASLNFRNKWNVYKKNVSLLNSLYLKLYEFKTYWSEYSSVYTDNHWNILEYSIINISVNFHEWSISNEDFSYFPFI